MHSLQAQARALGDPTRHALFRHVVAAGTADVAELTAAFGLNHNAIRQHLAKLVAAGLVVGEPSASQGRGRGRPRTVYRAAGGADGRWGVSGPYQRLSRWLLEILRSGDDPRVVGRRSGAERGAGLDALVEEMAREGFEPEVRRRGRRVDVVLHACPFADAAMDSPEVVCALHRGLAEGLAGDALVVEDLVVRDPRRAGCSLRCREVSV